MRSIRGVARLAAVLMVFFVILPLPALAQSAANTGQIVGQVLDPSKAALANVPIVVHNTATSFEREVRTDSAGRYAVNQLPLGPYDVTVNATGLQASTQAVY